MDLISKLNRDFFEFIKDKNLIKNRSIPLIHNIPLDWEFYPNSNDKWKLITVSSITTSCLYNACKGSIFPPHLHINNNEQCVILNKGGSVNVISENKGFTNYKYPESFAFDKSEWHIVEFAEDTELLVIWSPRMNDFEINYIK